MFSMTTDEIRAEELIRANQGHSQWTGMAKISWARFCGGAIYSYGRVKGVVILHIALVYQTYGETD